MSKWRFCVRKNSTDARFYWSHWLDNVLISSPRIFTHNFHKIHKLNKNSASKTFSSATTDYRTIKRCLTFYESNKFFFIWIRENMKEKKWIKIRSSLFLGHWATNMNNNWKELWILEARKIENKQFCNEKFSSRDHFSSHWRLMMKEKLFRNIFSGHKSFFQKTNEMFHQITWNLIPDLVFLSEVVQKEKIIIYCLMSWHIIWFLWWKLHWRCYIFWRNNWNDEWKEKHDKSLTEFPPENEATVSCLLNNNFPPFFVKYFVIGRWRSMRVIRQKKMKFQGMMKKKWKWRLSKH